MPDRSNLEFAHKNDYRQLISDTVYESLAQAWEQNQKPLLDECAAAAADQACHDAWISYNNSGLEIMQNFPDDFKTFDVRPGAQSVPSSEVYLKRGDLRKAIGAETEYDECAWPQEFIDSGDDARPFLDEMPTMVSAGVKVLIWTGDADYACDWFDTSQAAHEIEWEGQDAFAGKELESYTIGGEEKASFNTQNNLTSIWSRLSDDLVSSGPGLAGLRTIFVSWWVKLELIRWKYT